MKSDYLSALSDLGKRENFPKDSAGMGVEKVQTALQLLGITAEKIKMICGGDMRKSLLVAGTNGKGTVASTIAHLLNSRGIRVGFYSSPHLEKLNERIQVDLKPVSDDCFSKHYHFVNSKTKHLELTHFEILTVTAAFVFFSGEFIEPVEWAIFEVGLGGTLDATNGIPHGSGIVTSLGFDHCHILGNSILEIAKNKFGIIPNKSFNGALIDQKFPLIYKKVQSELEPFVETLKERNDVSLSEVQPYPFRVYINQNEIPQYEICVNGDYFPISLFGERAIENISIALQYLKKLGFEESLFVNQFSNLNWPGRFEIVNHNDKKIIFSGDHNPEGIKSLIEILDQFQNQKFLILAGVGKNKELSPVLNPLLDYPISRLVLTHTTFMQATREQYQPFIDKCEKFISNPNEALKWCLDHAGDDEIVLVTGSLYLVGDLRREFLVL